MNTHKLRDGQRFALNVLEDRIAQRKETTSIVLPTRYGKSDVMRLAAYSCKANKTAGCSIALSPGVILRNQLVAPEKVSAMVERYGLPYDLAGVTKVRTMKDAFEWRPFSNGEYLLSATIQLATSNPAQLAVIADHCLHEFKAPLLVHIDECHQTSEQKKRGELVEKLVNAGALVILYTATAIRADGEIIPGFSVDVLSEEESIRYECRESEDPKKILVDKYAGIKRLVRLRAHHETTFRQAWDERPSPLCNLSREVVDVKITDKNNEPVKLSQCSKSKASELLGKAVRHPEVVQQSVKMLINELTVRKRVNPDTAAMIFTCSDDGETANAHAKQVLEEIKNQQTFSDTPFQAVIVTLKTEEGDDKTAHAMDKFAHGQGDILIVKQMGGAGLDIGRLKVLVDLSSQRTVASVIQRLMRVATPWEGIRTGTVITLADPNMEAIWNRYVVEEGGEEGATGSQYEDELIESYEKDRNEKPDGKDTVTGAEFLQFDDNNGSHADSTKLVGVEMILTDFPFLTQHMTKAEIANSPSVALLSGKTPKEAGVNKTPLEQSIEKLRAEINIEGDRLVNAATAGRYSKELYGDEKKRIHGDAKKAAGIPAGTPLSQIKNVETLNRYLNFLQCQAS